MASANANDCDLTESAATQAMEVLVETETWDTNTVPTLCGCTDIPADEMTLSIDHIREQLFSLMTPKDLFNCRRLNRQWNSYATAELHERFEIKCTIKEGTLENYLKLLQKHQEIFPCLPLPIFRTYLFEKDTLYILSNPMLQQFLRTYGYFIRDLSLIQNLSWYSTDTLQKEKDVMEYIRSLLIHSAPNLSSLRMCGIYLKVDWKENSSDRYRNLRRPLRTTDPEFEEIHSIPDTEKNENLKFFSFTSISGKIFELAVQLAPNLKEIQVQSPYQWDHKYFIEPLDRLRYCKDIQYSADSSDLLKKFADLTQEGNLKLWQISFMFGMEDDTHQSPSWQPEFTVSYDDDDVDAINKILTSSSNSLETVTWKWVMEIPGLKWPQVMPNVWRINLGPHYRCLYDGLIGFPPDFVWSTTFPRLRELHFCEIIENSGFQHLLECFHGQRIDRVETVHVFEQNSEERDANTLANWEHLRRLFPSAQILSTWPFANFDSPSADSDEDMSP